MLNLAPIKRLSKECGMQDQSRLPLAKALAANPPVRRRDICLPREPRKINSEGIMEYSFHTFFHANR